MKIKPVEVQLKDRVTQKLQRGWTDVIVRKIWENCKLPCPFVFKKQQFFKKQCLPSFIFFGRCKECGAKIKGECKELSENANFVKICVSTYDTRGIVHKQKRNLANERRRDAKKALKYVKATHYRHVEANKFVNDSGSEPPFLNSTLIYRKARQEGKDEDIGIQEYPGHTITSILLMMDKLPCIRLLSVIPVYIWYWSQNQLFLWNRAAEMNTSISIDASGRFVKDVNIFDDNNSSSIFLYNITIRIKSKIYSICQMLSSRHDVVNIFSWLNGWLESGATFPRQVVVDCSYALLNGICLAFNKCTYNEYLCSSYKFLTKQTDNLPHCLVKRDRAHLIKASLKWKHFNNDNWVKKDFYIRCIAYSLEVEDLALLEDVILAIFIVCLSESMDKGTECYKRVQWLEKKIATFDYDRQYKEIDLNCSYEFCNVIDEKNDNSITDDIHEFIHQIKIKSECLSSNDENSLEPNIYYLPKLMDNLVSLYRQFPAWTNVMHSCFEFTPEKVSTSTASECYYRIMKREYGFNNPISLNRFILSHLPLIDGATKLGISALKETEFFQKHTHTKIVLEESKNDQSHEVGFRDDIKFQVNVSNHDINKMESFVKQLFEMKPFEYDYTLALYCYNEKLSFHSEKDLILLLSEFQTLKPESYVDGVVIDSYMIIKSNTEWKNINFFPTNQTNFIVGNQAHQEHPKSWKMYNIDNEFKGKVFIPYCYKAHWCLLMLNIDDHTIQHFDPLHRDNGYRAIKEFLNYLDKCNKSSKNNLAKIRWKVIQTSMILPRQKDGFNCGIFIIYYMDILAKEEKTSLAFDPDEHRFTIAQFLMMNKQSMENVCLYCYKKEVDEQILCNICNRWAHKKCISRFSSKLVDGYCELCIKNT